MVDRLHDDHQNAKEMAKIINEMKSPKVFVNYEDLETNIMMLNVNELNISEFCKRLGMVQEYERDALGSLISVKCSPWSESKIRLVTHVDISQEMGIKAAEKICLVLKGKLDLKYLINISVGTCVKQTHIILICLLLEFTDESK